MDRSLLTTLIVLVALTFVSALFSVLGGMGSRLLPIAIMGLAAAKFIMVAFRFMELRKAHAFWRTGVVVVAVLLAAIVGALVP
jgi:heme/copper-type cytochrome/quinol oxidase subunit 4